MFVGFWFATLAGLVECPYWGICVRNLILSELVAHQHHHLNSDWVNSEMHNLHRSLRSDPKSPDRCRTKELKHNPLECCHSCYKDNVHYCHNNNIIISFKIFSRLRPSPHLGKQRFGDFFLFLKIIPAQKLSQFWIAFGPTRRKRCIISWPFLSPQPLGLICNDRVHWT